MFDCSSKCSVKEHSLNEVLQDGPCLIPILFNVLVRFRKYPIALVADIRKMFLQDKSVRPKVYRMKVLTFGATSSPFFSQRRRNELRATGADI